MKNAIRNLIFEDRIEEAFNLAIKCSDDGLLAMLKYRYTRVTNQYSMGIIDIPYKNLELNNIVAGLLHYAGTLKSSILPNEAISFTDEYSETEELHIKAIQLEPTDATKLESYAWFLANRKGDIPNAEIIYDKAIKLAPNNANILESYAWFLANRKGDIPNAEIAYDKAIKLAPNNANILGSYAWFLANVKLDIPNAEIVYKKAMQLDPNNANVLDGYNWFLANRKKE